MGADCVVGVYLSAHWSQDRAPRHIFEVVGQCFSIAQSKMCDVWKKDADMVIEPDVKGFSYDAFDRAKQLIANGETAMRMALPELRKMLNLPDPTQQVLHTRAPVAAQSIQPSPAG
jgi:hypothetical protein